MFKSNRGQSFLVAIEGPDKVGKATQADLLEKGLNKRGLKAVRVEVPWRDGILYDLIYTMLKNGQAKEHPVVFQTLQGTNRRIMQQLYLSNLSIHFDIIILDRWTPSTWAFGLASGVSAAKTEVILQGIAQPDLTIILDGEPFTDRVEDTYEADSALQQKVRRCYQQYQATFPDSTVTVDAIQPRHTLAATLQRLVCQRYSELE